MIKDLRNILQQIHEPDEFRLTELDGSHPNYHIFCLKNSSFKDLKLKLRKYESEHQI